MILAIVILAALMLLGLPFLFNQSSSLTGTRALAHNQAAHIGEKSAEQLGIAIAADAMRNHLSATLTPVQPWTSLYDDLNQNYPAPYLVPYFFRDPLPTGLPLNRVGLNLSPIAPPIPVPVDAVPGLGFNSANPKDTALLGVTLEDESGKLDPNYLGVAAWKMLLINVSIQDVDGPDVDIDGELATALGNIRSDSAICPNGRIETLDALLKATPTAGRNALLQTELDLLRPFLTIHSRGQGRGGLIDLGTMLEFAAPEIPQPGYLDSLSPTDVLDFPVRPNLWGAGMLVGVGTHLYSHQPGDPGDTISFGQARSTSLTAVSRHVPQPGEAVAIESPAAVNVNTARQAVLRTLNNLASPTDLSILAPSQMPVGINLLDNTAKLVSLVDGGPNQISASLGITKTGFDYQIPVASIDEIASSVPEQTRDTDGLGAGPFVDANGVPILAGAANVVHLSGGNINDFPPSGYVLIVDSESGYRQMVWYSSVGSSAIWGVQSRPDLTLDPAHLANNSIRVIAIGPYELPPVSIASAGIVTVEGAATVTNKLVLSGPASNQQGAQQARRIVAQAVSHEELLEERWTTQADYHALITSRHGSLVAALPRPTNRVEYSPPAEPVSVAEDAAGITVLDKRNGLRPATLRTLTSTTHLSDIGTWKLELNGTFANCLESEAGVRTPPFAIPPAAGYDEKDLGTEGLVIDAGKRLSYPFNETNRGFFEMDPINDPIIPPGTLGANQEIKGRQFSFWVKPTEDWTGTVPILEMRMPIGNAGARFAGTMNPAGSTTDNREPGENTSQNYFTLVYDSDAKCLIMRLENGAIEHRADYGPTSPHEAFAVPSGAAPTVDPHCRGNDPGELHPIASEQPQPWGNTIQCRYFLGAEGMEPDAWYLIQGVFSSNTPGGMAIVVNGIVGRELSQISPLPPLLYGDHLTLPCLILKSALPARDIQATGANGLLEASILIDGYAPGPGGVITSGFSAVTKLLPMRGMIRVGDEYISYNNIVANGANAQLVNCVRARRQNTNQSSGVNAVRWPTVPQHSVGDQVYPGGYRLIPPSIPQAPNPPRGRLYRGGCTLAQAFGQGLSANDYRIVSQLTTAADVVPNGAGFTLPATATQLSVVDASSFPDHGIVKVQNELIAYSLKSGNALTGLTGLDTMDVRWPGMGAGPYQARSDVSWIGNAPTVMLVSMEVVGNNPVDPGRYHQVNDYYLQIMDPDTYRVEWISYTHIVDTTTGLFYFVNDDGFAASTERAHERTEFDPSQAFPIGSRVLPVQTEIESPWFISTGDVLTIAPKVVDIVAVPVRRPTQACVRYAATDGFSTTIGAFDASWDTRNGFFAFTEELPVDFAPGEYELLCWPCWSGNDISPLNPISAATTLPKFLLPWGNAFATDFLTGVDDRLLFIGGDDKRPLFNNAVNADAMGGVIDAGQASQQVGFRAADTAMVATWTPSPPQAASMAEVTAGLSVVSTVPIFPTDRTYGLVLIGGEVFAYQRSIDGQTAIIVGRALLGSQPLAHSASEPILNLPLGPVSVFMPSPAGQIIAPAHQGSVALSSGMNAPAILFCNPDGSTNEFEFIGLPNRKTAPWLRGMYNTRVVSWGGGGLPPLAIGWWPRYASALPGDSSDGWTNCSPEQRAALMRCRSYAWAGFPIRFYESFFDSSSQLADVFLLALPNHGGGQLFNLEARALRLGFDWSTQPAVLFDTIGRNDVSRAFVNKAAGALDDEQFTSTTSSLPIPTDGAELRVMWRYAPASYTGATGLADAARAANKAPMLGPVYVRCRAPSKILKVETAR